MTTLRWFLLGSCFVVATAALAQVTTGFDPSQFVTQAQVQTAVASAQAAATDFGGTVTLVQLGQMTPAASAGKRYVVSDLGGIGANGAPGMGSVHSTGTCFKRGDDAPAFVPKQASASIPVSVLGDSPSIQITGQSTLLNNVSVQVTDACPGDRISLYIGSNVLSAIGNTVGLRINGGVVASLTGISTPYSAVFVWDGSTAIKFSGGPVQ